MARLMARASAQSRYNDANRNLGYTNVKAPVDGQIGLINVTLGNYVSPSSGALTTINSIDPIYVTFPLESVDYDSLTRSDGVDNKNRKVELYFSDGSKYTDDTIRHIASYIEGSSLVVYSLFPV